MTVKLLFYLCFSFFYCSSCLASLAEQTIYLTWQRSPSTTMTIQWISEVDQPQTSLLYRSIDSSDWMEVSGHTYKFPQTLTYLIHQVELLSLKPDSQYLFKFVNSSKCYCFKTMPCHLNSAITFVIGGDLYHDKQDDLVTTCKQAALLSPSFAVLGGDIAYAGSSHPLKKQSVERWITWARCWHREMVTPRGCLIPVVAAIGNHDVSGGFYQSPAQARIFSALFPMPGKQIYNVLDFSNYLSILLLDSGHANAVEGKQSSWIKNELSKRHSITHRFAVYHVPAYPSVRPYSEELSQKIRKNWVPCFETGGISTVFEHHDHAYKRTYLLQGNQIDPKGILYLGDGAWGVKKSRAPINSRRKRPYLAKFLAQKHFIAVTLKQDSQVFRAISCQGEVLDYYFRKIQR